MGAQDTITEVRDLNTRYYYRTERWEHKILLLQK